MSSLRGRGAGVLLLCQVAVFAGASLVFWVQPLAARGLLPVLGGSAAVWNTAMVFFQSALLAGYALSHWVVRRGSRAGELCVLALLWAGLALGAPVATLRPFGTSPEGGSPLLWVLATLAGAVGVSFVAVSMVTPLVGAWLARARLGAASHDPYFLYATSNAGSAAALLAYPLLLEPLIGLERSAQAWSAVALALGGVLLVLWWRLPAPAAPAPTAPSGAAVRLRASRIVVLAALPSALLLGVTRHLTTDLAPVPLLWVVPLAIYLGTFVHAFARAPAVSQDFLGRLVPPALLYLALIFAASRFGLASAALHLCVFALASLWCHGALALLRPPASQLTRYYLLLCAGGLAGGVTVALLAPLLFPDVWEYPLALAVVAALLPATSVFPRGLLRGLACGVGVMAVLGGAFASPFVHSELSTLFTEWPVPVAAGVAVLVVVFLIGAVWALALVLRSMPGVLPAVLLAAMVAPSELPHHSDSEVLARERTFFGVYTVLESQGVRKLTHGTTLHGAEWPLEDGSVQSRTVYYGRHTPLGEVMEALRARERRHVLGLVGLGTGSLACYARDRDRVRFYEIDPMVVRLARTWFSALDTCAPDAEVIVGDARLSLERERGRDGDREPFDLLVLDAFASDAVPVHLLTREAFDTYLSVLASDGLIAVHISNRHLDLEPVLAALAEHGALAARARHFDSSEPGPVRENESSRVVVLAREPAVLDALGLEAEWSALRGAASVRLWTDDYASIVPLFMLAP